MKWGRSLQYGVQGAKSRSRRHQVRTESPLVGAVLQRGDWLAARFELLQEARYCLGGDRIVVAGSGPLPGEWALTPPSCAGRMRPPRLYIMNNPAHPDAM